MKLMKCSLCHRTYNETDTTIIAYKVGLCDHCTNQLCTVDKQLTEYVSFARWLRITDLHINKN